MGTAKHSQCQTRIFSTASVMTPTATRRQRARLQPPPLLPTSPPTRSASPVLLVRTTASPVRSRHLTNPAKARVASVGNDPPRAKAAKVANPVATADASTPAPEVASTTGARRVTRARSLRLLRKRELQLKLPRTKSPSSKKSLKRRPSPLRSGRSSRPRSLHLSTSTRSTRSALLRKMILSRPSLRMVSRTSMPACSMTQRRFPRRSPRRVAVEPSKDQVLNLKFIDEEQAAKGRGGKGQRSGKGGQRSGKGGNKSNIDLSNDNAFPTLGA